MNPEDLNVYKAWPQDVINQAITDFNEKMHDDAEANEISAGLHGLDFLTRASEFDDNTRARLEGAIIEGKMRVELLHQLEASRLSREELLEGAIKSVRILQQSIKSIETLIRNPPFTALEYIEHRRAKLLQ